MRELRANASWSSGSSTLTRKTLQLTLCSEIQQNKEQTQENMAQVRATLDAFQEEFQQKLQILSDDLHKQLDTESEWFRDTWSHNHKRM
jgi:hypothetical protein